MHIFALADTHFSLAKPKPMDIFGDKWENHHLKIKNNWKKIVNQEDWVLICGDISWGMYIDEALPDLNFIAELPGEKILIRGNHDYWWKSITKVKKALPETMHALQNDYIEIDGKAVCGTRGWVVSKHAASEDIKIYKRELIRAEISLQKAEKAGLKSKIFMLHFPPFAEGVLDTSFKYLFEKYGVEICIYGHLHGKDHRYAFEGRIEGVQYVFSACDWVDFTPVRII